MPRHDELRELTHDDVLAVANECLDEGIGAYDAAFTLWMLQWCLPEAVGSGSRDVYRQALLTWESTVIEKSLKRSH